MLDLVYNEKEDLYEGTDDNVKFWIKKEKGEHVNCYTIIACNTETNKNRLFMLFSEDNNLSVAYNMAIMAIREVK